MAIRLSGSQTHIAALPQSNRAGLAFGAFLRQELGPLLKADRLPLLAKGFADYLASKNIRQALDEAHASTEPTDPYDSHPSFEERAGHAQRLNITVAPRADDAEPSLGLLHEVAATELELIRFTTERSSVMPVSWEEPGQYLVPLWRDELSSIGAPFRGCSLVDAPRTPQQVRALCERNETKVSEASDEQVMNLAFRITWLACGLRLTEVGFHVHNQPGEPIRLQRGSSTVDLNEVITQYHGPEGSAAAWQTHWQDLGIATASLAA